MASRARLRRGISVVAACAMVGAALPVTASAQPDVEPVVADAPAPGAVPPPPPLPDGAVVSTPPVTTDTPDGWTLTLSARDETQAVSNPLTTALSSREYVVGGTFAGELTGPEGQEPPRGVLEVGYEIGCGIDMSTSNGVSLTGTAGFNPNIGIIGTDVISPLPDGIGPVIGGNIGGGITIGLKPGFVNVVQVTEKEFTGAAPWVKVTNFRVNIDGCVGQSFIRSYALLTHTTDMSEAVLAWYGTTKVV